MATPEVKVRLSAEGQQEVITAFRAVARESAAAGAKSTTAFNAAASALNSLKSLVSGITIAALVQRLVQAAQTSIQFTDALDDTARSLGTTSTYLQEMTYIAVESGVPIDVLAQAFAVLEQKMAAAAAAGKPVVQFLDGTSISATNADGSLRPLREVMDEIITAGRRLPEGVDRLSGASLIWNNKIGPKMANLLGLSAERLEQLRREAHDTGYVIEQEFVTNGGAVNDQLEQFAVRLKAAFASGLLDFDTSDVDDLHRIFTDPGLIAGVRGLGAAFRELVLFVRDNSAVFEVLLATAAGGRLGAIAGAPFGLPAAGAILGGGIAGGGVLQGVVLGREIDAAAAAESDILSDKVKARRAEIEAARQRRAPVTTTKVVDPTAAASRESLADKIATSADAIAAKAERAAEQAEAAFTRAGEKADRDAARIAQVRKQAYDASVQYETQLLEQQGRRHEAEIANLNSELATYEDNLRKRGDLDEEEIARRTEAARQVGERTIAFADLQRDAQAAQNDIDARRVEIQEAVARGQISEQEGIAQLVALDRDRLGNLEKIAEAMERIAAASGDPEQIAAAQQLKASISGLRVEADQAGQAAASMRREFADAAENELADFFSSILDGTKTASEAFKDLASGILKEFTNLIAKRLAKALMNSLLGGGSGSGGLSGLLGIFGIGSVAAATGGLITGPGTGTSDSIPARLSNGEFVVRAAAVAQPGNLEALRHMNRELNFPPVLKPRPRSAYRDGGLVTASPAMAGGGTMLHQLQVDESTMRMTIGDYLTSILAAERWKNRK